MTAIEQTPLLEASHLSLSFNYIEALTDVSLSLAAHEVVALVGDNGAGKSTLLKTFAGLFSPDTGFLRVRGEKVTLSSVRAANDLGIASIFQDVNMCMNLDVAANIFLGQEIANQLGNRDDENMHIQAREILSQLSSPLSAFRSLEGLSTGEKQTVAIARAMLHDPDIVLMDEPTASLSVIQTAQVLSYIKELRARGKAILLVCHNLPDVFAVADRIAVMRHGRLVTVHRTAHTSYEQIIAEIAGARTVNEEFINTENTSEPHKLIDRYN
ncbi:ATP-binding cassette domain-containing protein [Alloscardovia sp. HMSC034E08]|uniref:ATP-binding cassette domain-containing protein n=1 Tax=Alloscardovia sp. HMSC034E08 TaxID=1739413 RepID=UPI0008D2A21B|nr:ATP-binding cassette domain-containing protein [Alloscardovia sp. HMSC034E08]OFQ99330.1 ABC transporter ATP-binding protein [Alloscardovia sp. HMSC034E08]